MLVEPKSAEELYYYTDRDICSGSARVWVFKLKCPKCSSYVQKPRDKNGKPMKKADYYECQKCGFRMDAKEYESKLMANIQYKCPYCGFKGELQIPFSRKNVYFKEFDEAKGKEKKSKVLALVFKCEKCQKEIYVTQKMKDVK
ncbi:MAG: hypothetical protein ACP5OZ_04915 [Candidatus Woesearchaeota archaeon]